MIDGQHPAWHQALAYAVTGRAHDGWERQASPNLAALAELLQTEPDQPSEVPAELLAGIGPAQFAAALTQLRSELRWRRSAPAVIADRTPDAAEQRLIADSPPHH